MYDIFISYSHQDRDRVAKLAEVLESQGYDVWWDRELLVSQDYASRIEIALNASNCVLTAWSTHSVKSRWVRAESGRGFDEDKLVPILLEDCKIPIPFDSVHTADLRTWKGDVENAAFVGLLKALEWRLNKQTDEPLNEPPKQNNLISDVGIKPATTTIATPPPEKQSKISWILGLGLMAGVAIGAYTFVGSGSTPTSPTANPKTPTKQDQTTPPTDPVALKNCQQPNSNESIVQASGRGHLDRVKECIRLGVDVNLRDGKEWMAIHAAAFNGHLEIVKLLVSHGATINAEANSRRTTLHLAVMANKYDVAHYLKSNGVSVNKADATGALPFALAKTDQMRKLLSE